MPITRVLLPAVLSVVVAALALASPAAGGRHGFAVHGWAATPTATTVVNVTPGQALLLSQLPLTLSYAWAQPTAAAVTASRPLMIAQLPVLWTYDWAQPWSL